MPEQEPQQNKIAPPETPIQEKLVQTYATDMAQVIGDDQGGLIKKIIHEEEEKDKEKRNTSPESIKNKIFVYAGTILLALAAGTFAYFFMNRPAASTIPTPAFTPMIFTDKATLIDIKDLKKDEITKALWDKATQTEVKYGGIEGFYPTIDERVVGLRQFAALLKSPLTLNSSKDLVDDNFLIGVYSWETKSPFILIKMRTMPDIFNSMRSWEGKMFYDLHGIFGVDINADTNYLLTKDFEDGIVENKNARILHGEDGNIVLMYVYVDDSHTLIANDLVAVREVFVRLAGSRIKQ